MAQWLARRVEAYLEADVSGWTEEFLDFARRLHQLEGMSAEQIAKKLGMLGFRVSRSAVIGKLTRAGVMGNQERLARERREQAVRHMNHKRASTKAAIIKRNPVKAEPFVARGAPKQGPCSVRFIDRKPNQCAFFCEGQDGPEGLVCGDRVVSGAWCAHCVRIVYRALTPAEKALLRRRAA